MKNDKKTPGGKSSKNDNGKNPASKDGLRPSKQSGKSSSKLVQKKVLRSTKSSAKPVVISLMKKNEKTKKSSKESREAEVQVQVIKVAKEEIEYAVADSNEIYDKSFQDSMDQSR